MKVANRLADASVLTSMGRITAGVASARTSRRSDAPGASGTAGSQRQIAAAAPTPIGTMAPKAMRQPAHWPSAVPSGTPSTLASVRPENMTATARERCPGGTRVVATTAPMPKKVPWQSAVSNRAAIRNP